MLKNYCIYNSWGRLAFYQRSNEEICYLVALCTSEDSAARAPEVSLSDVTAARPGQTQQTSSGAARGRGRGAVLHSNHFVSDTFPSTFNRFKTVPHKTKYISVDFAVHLAVVLDGSGPALVPNVSITVQPGK